MESDASIGSICQGSQSFTATQLHKVIPQGMRLLAVGDSLPAFLHNSTTPGVYLARVDSPDRLIATIQREHPDAILVSVQVHGRPIGASLCRGLRTMGVMQPIVILAESEDPKECASLLDAGATEYLTPEDNFAASLLRVAVSVHRFEVGKFTTNALATGSVVSAGPLLVNRTRLSATHLNEVLHLPRQCVLVLSCLVEHVGEVVTHAELELVGELPLEASHRRLHTVIWRLRVSLEARGVLIEAIRGRGFRLRSG